LFLKCPKPVASCIFITHISNTLSLGPWILITVFKAYFHTQHVHAHTHSQCTVHWHYCKVWCILVWQPVTEVSATSEPSCTGSTLWCTVHASKQLVLKTSGPWKLSVVVHGYVFVQGLFIFDIPFCFVLQ
jgi:hypothetical protein